MTLRAMTSSVLINKKNSLLFFIQSHNYMFFKVKMKAPHNTSQILDSPTFHLTPFCKKTLLLHAGRLSHPLKVVIAAAKGAILRAVAHVPFFDRGAVLVWSAFEKKRGPATCC